MNDSETPPGILHQTYPSAAKGVVDSRRHAITLQTESASYALAFTDDAFLLRDAMRGVRLQLEFQKADLIQIDEEIESTVVVFGGARILEPSVPGHDWKRRRRTWRDHPVTGDCRPRSEWRIVWWKPRAIMMKPGNWRVSPPPRVT